MQFDKTFTIFINILDYINELNNNPNLREDFSVSKKLITDTVNALGYEFINLTNDFVLTFKETGENSYYQLMSNEKELSIKLLEKCGE